MAQAYRKQYGTDFISAMPTNLYGPGDNYDLFSSHVVPALIRKIHEAKTRGETRVVIWGTGTALREFLHVDDCADACVHLMKNYSDDMHINVGSGSELTILELANLICDVVGFHGQIERDLEKPDGTPRKLMDSQKLFDTGWKPTIGLREGIANAYQDYLAKSRELIRSA